MGAFLEQSSFTGGELSPKLYGQTKLDKYGNALRRMENFIPLPHGPAVFRPGTKFIKAAKHADKDAVIVPFLFSKSDAMVLEFGDYYIRFYKEETQIVKTYAAWQTATWYAIGDLVTNDGNYYRCCVAHTSGTFSTDLTAVKWALTSSTDLAYEIVSPYTESDVAGLQFCQSADVIYIFHADYPVRKLMRYDDDNWEIIIADFRPPPLKDIEYYPSATLTPSDTTGIFVSFTASASVFLAGDATREISSGTGRAIIKTVYSGTVALCEIIHEFENTNAIASGQWKITGSPSATVKPSSEGPINSTCLIQTDEGSDNVGTLVSIIIEGEDCWAKSSKNYYYLKNSASCYTGTEPAILKHFSAGWIPKGSDVNDLYGWQWGWGDADTLGYNTIYLCWWWFDPDKMRPDEVMRSTTTSEIDCFREGDVGKYISIFNGVVRVDEYLTAKSVSGTILKELNADRDPNTNEIEASMSWAMYEELWSATNGYPSCGAIFEERLMTGGVKSAKDNLRGSVSGDYENHCVGVDDDDAIDFTLGGRYVKNIQWLDPRDHLIVGTDSCEWKIGSDDGATPLTPTKVSAREQTNHGCAAIPPIPVGNCTLFVQSALKKLREFTIDPQSVNLRYIAPDLTVLAEHITKSGISWTCYQQEPFSIVWAGLSDGTLVAMTYLREQEVVAWHKHPTTGEVLRGCCIPHEGGYDQLWLMVKRRINGVEKRYIEVLSPYFDDDVLTWQENKGENAYYCDCGATYNGSETTTITGVDHLEGEPVVVVADGAYAGVKTVLGGGFTISKAASIIHYGLTYEGMIETLNQKVDLKDGTAQGRMKKIAGLIIRLYASGPFKAGRDQNHLEDVIFRAQDDSMGVAPKLLTGDKKVSYEGGIDRNARLVIVQDKPLPLQIQAIYPEVSMS